MHENSEQTMLLSAMTTEHFVLQTACNSTISEAASRSTLYVMALSSSLVAVGFLSRSPDLLMPFVLAVFPTVFLLGVFTVIRLVDTALENMKYLTGIARIRAYYRSLCPMAAHHFTVEQGRWPEAASPALRLGSLSASLGTAASMIAVINCVVGAAVVAFVVQVVAPTLPNWYAVTVGIGCALILTLGFLRYQRWRFAAFDTATTGKSV